MENTLLSIVIPTKNRDMFLKETLCNIYSGLTERVEVVIIDGMSKDNTKSIVQYFLEKHSDLKYIEMQTAEGLDKELDIGVQSAKGQYCWVFSDDDIIYGTDINNVVKFLEKRQNLDVLLVNSSIWNKELNHIILDKFLDHEDMFGAGADRLFTYFIDYLSFIGGCIIKKEYWIKGQAFKYYGSLFVHVGIIFSSQNIEWGWLKEPIVKIRYGNASWSARAQEIWLKLWPELIMGFDNVPIDIRLKKVTLEPFSIFKKLIFFKALNCYNTGSVNKIAFIKNKKFTFFLIKIVNLFPQFLCYGLSYFYARISKKPAMLYDLKNVS